MRADLHGLSPRAKKARALGDTTNKRSGKGRVVSKPTISDDDDDDGDTTPAPRKRLVRCRPAVVSDDEGLTPAAPQDNDGSQQAPTIIAPVAAPSTQFPDDDLNDEERAELENDPEADMRRVTMTTSCNRRYYHNYVVHKETSLRTYYGGVPDVVQVAQHFFIESALLELFTNNMVFGWLSATNCARIYNEALSSPQPHIVNNKLAFTAVYYETKHLTPDDWKFNCLIRKEDTMNGFFLYSLLLDKAEHDGILMLPHDEASQSDRLQPALAERNSAMEGTGQECYAHACDLCFAIVENAQGQLMKIHPAACDGNTIGHRSCKVHDCKNPYPRNASIFVQIIDVSQRSAPSLNAHPKTPQDIEPLRSRLKKSGVAVPDDSVPLDAVEEDHEVIFEIGPKGPVEVDDEACDGKPESGNRKLRAIFGGRRTHNEQLIMRTCGVILSRATLFGSEAVSAVNLFAKATFPTPESTPELFIFDNNCKLDAHQRAIHDKHFKNTGKPVNVFHFKCKHKVTDLHCQRYCNPAAFPEMIGPDGKWRFNTSICEQTNVWFGGYIAIVRDMEATRYNFFLDEMIKRRNRYVVSELERKGYGPWTIPMEAIFPAAMEL
ncbi:hypothetical protein C8R43DRAFT_1137271 [Mycena crocata]|nr:hypothetical protein C8R43DRAFT_1137271 [Mycena crocata]